MQRHSNKVIRVYSCVMKLEMTDMAICQICLGNIII